MFIKIEETFELISVVFVFQKEKMEPSVITIIQHRNTHCLLLQKQLIDARSRKSLLELDVVNLIANHVLFMHDCSSFPIVLSIEADGKMKIDNLENYSSEAVGVFIVSWFFKRANQLRHRSQLEEIELAELLENFEEFERLEDPFFFGKWEGQEKNETKELLNYANNLNSSLENFITFYKTLFDVRRKNIV